MKILSRNSIAAAVAFVLLAGAESPAANLRHHYKLDGNATDTLGVANLTPTGDGVTFPATGGAVGGFVRLAGSDDYLLSSLDAGSAMSILGDYSTFRPYSVSFWVRQTASQATAGTVAVYGVTTNAPATPNFNTGFEVITRESGNPTNAPEVRLRCRNNETGDGAGAIDTNTNIANGSWHHIVAVYETGSRSIYIDGVLRGTNNAAVNITTNPLRYFAIGAFIRAGQILDDLNGDVDDFQIYEGALSPVEALSLYQNPGQTIVENPPAPGTAIADLVDPLYGVAAGTGTGSCVPGACLPHSSIYPSPNTQAAAAGGFAAGSPVVGFAQLHATGSGSSTMSFGNFLVSPRTGAGITEASHASPISNVTARPYSYRGRLTTWSTDCTVVPTANCAIYQFDFPSSADARINFDVARKLNSTTGMSAGSITIDTVNGTISGGGTFDGNWNPAAYNVYFYAKVDATPTSGGTFVGSISQDGTLSASTASRQRLGGWMRFNTTATRSVRMKIAVSFTSVARAQQYLNAEIPAWDLAGLEAAAKARWNDTLSAVQVPGASASEARKLYTALFHSLIQPRDRTGDPANWPTDAPFWDDHYTLWDTWQTLFPLLAIVDPASTAANINSLGERFARNGKAETAFIQGKDFQVGQGGDEVDRIICDAYVKGIPGIDWSKIWPLLQFNAGRRTPDYINLGFVSTDGSHNGYDSRMASGSSTLAFAHGDWCAAQIGFGLGYDTEAQALLTRSRNWRNVWDATASGDGFTGFVRGRARNGAFTTTAPTSGSGSDFYQGTCWNYSFSVPHEQNEVIALMGGRARFIQRLEFAFGKNNTSYLDFSNEGNMKAPAFFAHTGRPYLGSYWNDRIRQLFGSYSVPGDEDSGAMSSLYFFLTAGFYPSAAEDIYYLHGARVPELRFNVGGGKTFTITAANSGGQNLYVQSATLNGQPLTTPIIHHADIMAGSTLAFVMGPNPSSWGTRTDFAAPPQPDQTEPVSGPWTAALGSPQITGSTTSSPGWGAGTNGADNTAIYSAFPEVLLNQAGASVTLTATVKFNGLATSQAAPSDRFAWGLFSDGGQAGVTGWPGYLAGNDTTDAVGTQKSWRKASGSASAFYSTSGATAQTSFALATPSFTDGTFTLVMTLTRTDAGALDCYAALKRTSDGTLFSAFTSSDPTPATFAFNRVGFRVGDVLDADSIEIGQCTIYGDGTLPNVPPSVALTAPNPGEVLNAPASIAFTADAADSDGTIVKVEYFANDSKVGEAASAPYSFVWNGIISGTYTLTARAIDNAGASTVSAPVDVTVANPDNIAPSIAITSPSPGIIYAGDISLAVNASDPDGMVSKVEFFNGATKLGESTTAPFTFAWDEVPVGSYTLTAVATDNDGGVATSVSVPIGVQGSPLSFSEDFDSMGAAGTAPPSGWSMWIAESGTTNETWADAAGIPSNGAASVASMVPAPTPLTVNNAPSNTNNNGYNAQGASSTDRVLTTSPTGVAGGAIQWQVTNTGAATITTLRIGYDIRRFTVSSSVNELPGYRLFYSLDGATWTNVAALTPTLAGAGVQVPNTVGVTTVPPTNFSVAGGLAPGATLRLRWVDDNAEQSSPDQILGLDRVTLTAAAGRIGVAPTVALASPLATDLFVAPATVPLAATVADPDGTVTKVDFFNGTTKLGEATAEPFAFSWANVAPGTYTLTARAIDSDFNITTSAPVVVKVVEPGTDTDGDGIPDEWEVAHGLNRFSAADGALDSDGDGLTNLEEYRAGTEPFNAADKPRVAQFIAQPDGSVTLRIPTTLGRNYRVEANNQFPTGSWSVVADGVTGTDGLVSVPDPGAAGVPNRIYRVTVQLPNPAES